MLGDKIRDFRKQRQKTLSAIADLTGLSVSYISQLERGNLEPSLSSLRKIADALDVPVYMFMADEQSEDFVQRKEKRTLMTFQNSPISFEIASIMPNKTFEPSMLLAAFTLQANSCDVETYLTHDSDELTILLTGELNIVMGGDASIHLKAGDTLYIKKHTPHRYTNNTDHEAKGYVIFSPPRWPVQGN